MLAVAAGLAALVGGLTACGTGATSSARSAVAAGDTAVTERPAPGATMVASVSADCRMESAPVGTDAYGVRHSGERICTWGPEMLTRLDSNGFVIPAQNHPVDVAMAARCWSADGRVYLRTPASDGWACIGGSPTSTARPTSAALTVASTLTLRGLGPVRVGMTAPEASAAAGLPIVPMGGSGETCVYAKAQGGPEGVSFMFVSGRLARIDVTSRGTRTASGAAVGDSEARVQAIYSGQLVVTPHKYIAAGRYLTLVPSDPADADLRLIFETDGSKVTRFRAGTQPAVSYTEGCS